MNDKWKIILGLVVFLAAVTFPVWRGAIAGAGEPPELQLPEGKTKCIESKEFMIDNHMNMLDEWRNMLVREDIHEYTSKEYGDTYEISLNKTCLNCHKKTEFCDKCHAYADVEPYCWDCHYDPKGD